MKNLISILSVISLFSVSPESYDHLCLAYQARRDDENKYEAVRNEEFQRPHEMRKVSFQELVGVRTNKLEQNEDSKPMSRYTLRGMWRKIKNPYAGMRVVYK